MIDMHEPVVHDFVMYAIHDVACAVCGVEKAVLHMNTGVFQPCWKCQSDGWITKKKRRWFR